MPDPEPKPDRVCLFPSSSAGKRRQETCGNAFKVFTVAVRWTFHQLSVPSCPRCGCWAGGSCQRDRTAPVVVDQGHHCHLFRSQSRLPRWALSTGHPSCGGRSAPLSQSQPSTSPQPVAEGKMLACFPCPHFPPLWAPSEAKCFGTAVGICILSEGLESLTGALLVFCLRPDTHGSSGKGSGKPGNS